jgi:hypothetical protein
MENIKIKKLIKGQQEKNPLINAKTLKYVPLPYTKTSEISKQTEFMLINEFANMYFKNKISIETYKKLITNT